MLSRLLGKALRRRPPVGCGSNTDMDCGVRIRRTRHHGDGQRPKVIGRAMWARAQFALIGQVHVADLGEGSKNADCWSGELNTY